MQLITANPLQEFYQSLGKAPVKTINVVSPFITQPGIRGLIEGFKRKRTRIQILTNLSGLNVALSISDPVTPLLEILDALGDRVHVKSYSNLHAKLYLCEGRAALVGSSNLTYGGMERNIELNWLIEGRKKEDKQQMYLLKTWFDQIWVDAGRLLTRKELESIEDTWKRTQGRIMGIVAEFMPQPRLKGDYFGKVRMITRRKQWTRKAIEKILSESDDGSAQNTTRKLYFLKELGLLDFDQRSVTIKRKMNSPLEMFNLLEEGHLQISLKSILRSVHRSKSGRMSYRALARTFDIPEYDEALHVTTIWLESLGYVLRHHTRGVDEFTLTKQGQNLVIS